MFKMIAVGGAVLLATSLLVTAGDKPAKGEKHGKRGDMMESMFGKLNLTDEQKAKIKKINESHASKRQEFEKAHKEELEAAGQDRAKRGEIMKPMREAWAKDVMGALNDEQKEQFKKAMIAGKAAHGRHGDNKQ